MAPPLLPRFLTFQREEELATATATTSGTGGVTIPDRGRVRHIFVQQATQNPPVLVLVRIEGHSLDVLLGAQWVRGGSPFTIRDALSESVDFPYDGENMQVTFRVRNDTGVTIRWVGRVVIEFDD